MIPLAFAHLVTYSWNSLRETEGWAALQHHAVLRATLILHPPSLYADSAPHLLISLKRGSFFAILPCNDGSSAENFQPPEWHPGNIYDMERAIPASVGLPVPPSTTKPTAYYLFISGDYEARREIIFTSYVTT